MQSPGSSSRSSAHLADVLGHDIRNALNSVTLYAELLLKGSFGPVNEKQIEVLADIQEHVHNTAAAFDEALDKALALGGMAGGTAVSVRLQGAVERALATTGEGLRARGQEVQVDVEDLAVWADPERLEQVLAILLRDASEASPQGATIGLGARPGASGPIELSVSDQGPLLEDEDGARVFDPSFRNPRSAKKSRSLDLAVARRLLEAWGGDLTYRRGEQGSVFVARLAAAPAEAARQR